MSPVKLKIEKDKKKPKREKDKKGKSKKKKKAVSDKELASLDLLHQHTTEKLQEMEEEQKNVYVFPVRT